MNKELCIPVSALAIPSEEGQSVTPEMGDSVTVSVEGKISRIEGDQAYLTITSANGEPVAKDEGVAAEPNMDEEGDSLRAELENY